MLRTRSPSSAAVELGFTRSTVHKALEQLRSELSDQLLVRRGSRMTLTRRAARLTNPLSAILSALDRLFEEAEGQARQSTAAIALCGEVAPALAPRLVRRLATEGPRITLKIVPYEHHRLVDDLDRRTIDIAVAVDPPRRPDVWVAPLYKERFVCLTADRAPLTLERYSSAGHVTMAASHATAAVDAALARRGRERRIVAHVPHLAALLRAAETQGLCATLPCRVALAMRPANLFVHALPLPVPDLAVSLVWHRRWEHDPDNRWLRELVASAARR